MRMLQESTVFASTGPTGTDFDPGQVQDAHRAVQLAVQRTLAADWEWCMPRIAVAHQNGTAAVHVSTVARVGPPMRAAISEAVRSALAPYARLAPSTNVVFLTRVAP
jgi:hypothetical protein